MLSYYLSHGFDQVKAEMQLHKESGDVTTYRRFADHRRGRRSLSTTFCSGLHFTRPNVVRAGFSFTRATRLTRALYFETQRNLYNLGTPFNEVITAVQNPTGDAPRKNTLIQVTEAKRWNVTYGFGFEAQTGNPGGTIQSNGNSSYSPEGRAGAVRAVLGRLAYQLKIPDAALHVWSSRTIAVLTFQNPHLFNSKNLGPLSAPAATRILVMTFASSTLQEISG